MIMTNGVVQTILLIAILIVLVIILVTGLG